MNWPVSRRTVLPSTIAAFSEFLMGTADVKTLNMEMLLVQGRHHDINILEAIKDYECARLAVRAITMRRSPTCLQTTHFHIRRSCDVDVLSISMNAFPEGCVEQMRSDLKRKDRATTTTCTFKDHTCAVTNVQPKR